MMQLIPTGDRYRSARERLSDVVAQLDADGWARPVPACPGWDVHDVVAHLVGVVEDSGAGRLDGPPGPEQTAAEVDRHRASPPDALLGRWAELAPPFEQIVSELSIWPAFFDVLSHEHDVHGALGTVGDRASEDVRVAAKLLVRGVDLGRPLRVVTEDDEWESRGEGEPWVLRAAAFEVFRLRLGRRSRDQVRRMDWSEDPVDIIDRLVVFGPAVRDLVE